MNTDLISFGDTAHRAGAARRTAWPPTCTSTPPIWPVDHDAADLAGRLQSPPAACLPRSPPTAHQLAAAGRSPAPRRRPPDAGRAPASRRQRVSVPISKPLAARRACNGEKIQVRLGSEVAPKHHDPNSHYNNRLRNNNNKQKKITACTVPRSTCSIEPGAGPARWIDRVQNCLLCTQGI